MKAIRQVGINYVSFTFVSIQIKSWKWPADKGGFLKFRERHNQKDTFCSSSHSFEDRRLRLSLLILMATKLLRVSEESSCESNVDYLTD